MKPKRKIHTRRATELIPGDFVGSGFSRVHGLVVNAEPSQTTGYIVTTFESGYVYHFHPVEWVDTVPSFSRSRFDVTPRNSVAAWSVVPEVLT